VNHNPDTCLSPAFRLSFKTSPSVHRDECTDPTHARGRSRVVSAGTTIS
jgi:hypothetical protein